MTERVKRPLRPGEVVDLGRELNGFTDKEGNPESQKKDDLEGFSFSRNPL